VGLVVTRLENERQLDATISCDRLKFSTGFENDTENPVMGIVEIGPVGATIVATGGVVLYVK
jgi:hypothetical protein